MDFFFSDGIKQWGPIPREQLKDRGLRADMLVWREGMGAWQRADSVEDLRDIFATPGGPPPVPTGYAPPAYSSLPSDVNGKKIAAGICGIMLGTFGIHKFILGMTNAGVTMVLITVLTCFLAAPVMHIIGIIEGIIYLTKTDEEFYQLYIVGQKSWF